MKVTRYLFLALLLSVVSATAALALPANKVLTVQLMSLSAVGQLSPARSISVTTDAVGKVAFTFPNVPTSDIAPFLLVRILDGSIILRQSVSVAPTPNGTTNVGISEVTTSQATAMLKAFSDSHSSNATLAAMILSMIRSGAIADADLQNISPLARAATNAVESFLASSSSTGNLAAFRANLLPAMRDLAAKYKESVDVALIANDANTSNPTLDLQNKALSNSLEAGKRGDAIANFLSALVKAGADAGISPSLMHMALTEAGNAVEAYPQPTKFNGPGSTLTAPVSADVVSAVLAIFRTGAAHCQLLGQMSNYAHALPFMNVTTATRQPQFLNVTTAARQQQLNAALQQFNNSLQQFNSAATTLGNDLLTAEEVFELLFADPVNFPNSQDIITARDNLILTLQSLNTKFIVGTTGSSAEIAAMQTNMATGMGKLGVVMTNMTSLQHRGIGSIFTSPTASSQNWLEMMLAGANYVTPALQMTYSSSVSKLAANFPTVSPPVYSLYANPYKSLLRLQFDLMLLKFNNQAALAQALQPVTQAALAQIKENDLALKNTLFQGLSVTLSGNVNNTNLANAFMIIMAQPELL